MFAFRNLGVEPISSYRRIFSSNQNREFKWAYQGILNGVTGKMNACLGFELVTFWSIQFTFTYPVVRAATVIPQ